MPTKFTTLLILIFTIGILFSETPFLFGYEGISVYYARYDEKYTQNKLADDNLLIVPAEDEFRVEKFSLIPTSGAISAGNAMPANDLHQQIRNHALKNILSEKGLKSVKTKDADTIISYEGAVKLPVHILKKTVGQTPDTVFYEVEVEFSPITFPDQWESLGVKTKIKNLFNDILHLFK